MPLAWCVNAIVETWSPKDDRYQRRAFQGGANWICSSSEGSEGTVALAAWCGVLYSAERTLPHSKRCGVTDLYKYQKSCHFLSFPVTSCHILEVALSLFLPVYLTHTRRRQTSSELDSTLRAVTNTLNDFLLLHPAVLFHISTRQNGSRLLDT